MFIYTKPFKLNLRVSFMKAINLVEKDRVGLLMDISYILAKENINIESISVTTVGGKAIISLVVKNTRKAEEVLKKNGFNVVKEEVILIKLKDQPGELSKVAKLLSDNKVNIKNVYIVSRDGKETVVALMPDRLKKAKKLLEEHGYTIEQHSEI